MELHSYAKRKSLKKWTLEQKRKLVETRINNDAMFNKLPRNSVLPWKKVLTLAKLDDFNVFFVRKQWSSMVAKYKQYKQNKLGHVPTQTIDNDMITKISEEWEFFNDIHNFMTRKTTNLHSYASQAEPKEQCDDKQPTTSSNSQMQQSQQQDYSEVETTERMNFVSSDTNEDVLAQNYVEMRFLKAERNHDHDYGKIDRTVPLTENVHAFSMQMDQVGANTIASTTTKEPSNQNSYQKAKLSEREKYYRHKRRFDRRLEQRFDALLNVFGQIVQQGFPSVNVSPLLAFATAAGDALINGQHINSDEESSDSEASEEATTNGSPVQNKENGHLS